MQKAKVGRIVLGTAAAAVFLAIATSPLTTVLLFKHHSSQIVENSIVGLTTSGLAHLSISEGFLETSMALNPEDSGDLEKRLS